MKDIVYRFMNSIKRQDFPLKENERKFALYALVLSTTRQNEIVCKLSLQDGLYFLCGREADEDEFACKTEELIKAFSVRLKGNKRTSYLNLLNRVTVVSSKVILVFDQNLIDCWLSFKENKERPCLQNVDTEFADIEEE